MLKTVSVQTLEIQAAIYPNDEIARHLNRLTEHADVLDFLIAHISPIKVVKYKRKLYPVEYLDEVLWLRSHFPEVLITSFTIETAKTIADVEQHIYSRLILKHLSSMNNKDLHGLEQKWKEQSNGRYLPRLTQKQWTQLLNCERSLLLRHRKQLIKSHETFP